MATGRKYVEKMIEGVATLDLAGTLNVTGSTMLYGDYGYRMKIKPIATNTDLTPADSGAVIIFLGNNLTASLPNGALGWDGTANTAGGMTFHFTTLNPDNNNFRITGSNQGGTKNCFVGSIVGSAPTGSGTTAAAANNQLNVANAAFGDCITFVSTGDLTALGDVGGSRWIILNSSVEVASSYTFTD
tara:strand:+ start:60 stop:620 length:561 start_codon:yes stop_codon:yes gene_type:complete